MNNYPSGPQQPYPQQPTTNPYPSNPGYPPQGQPYPQGPGYPPPPQQPIQPPKKKGKLLWIILGCVGALVLCGVIANTSSHSNSGTKVDTTANTDSTTSSSNSQPVPSAQHFKVGDTVKAGTDWQVVVNGIKTSSGGQFDTLKPGKTFIEVDVSLTNTSSQERTTSSIGNWTLLDSTGAKADWDTVADGSSPAPDGKIEPGQTLRGTLAYQADATQKKFTLEFSPDVFGSGQTLWDLSV